MNDPDTIELTSIIASATRKTNAAAEARSAAVQQRLWALTLGQAMIFKPGPGESGRGLKIRLTHAIKRMDRQSEIVVLDGKLSDGRAITYARLRAGFARLTPPGGIPAPMPAPRKAGRPRKS